MENSSGTQNKTVSPILANKATAKQGFLSAASKKLVIASVITLIVSAVFMPWSTYVTFAVAFYAILLTMLLSFVSFLSGVFAAIIICIRRKQLGDNHLTIAICGSLIIFLLATAVFPPWLDKKRVRLGAEYAARLKLPELHKAIVGYSHNHNGHLPTSDLWCDLLMKDDPTLGIYAFQYRDFAHGECSVAFNENLGGLPIADVPGNVVLLFEANGDWNLSGEEELLSSKEKEPGYSFVLFMDGTIGKYKFSKGIILDRKSDKSMYVPLRWKP